jgi:hypothetical protein
VFTPKFSVPVMPTVAEQRYLWENAWETTDSRSGVLVFKAKAPSNIIVGLAASKDTEPYAVFMGGDSGRLTGIFEKLADSQPGIFRVTPKQIIKDPAKLNTYWIKYSPQGISCGQGSIPGRDVFATSTFKVARSINYIVFYANSVLADIEYVSLK